MKHYLKLGFVHTILFDDDFFFLTSTSMCCEQPIITVMYKTQSSILVYVDVLNINGIVT